MFDRKNLINHHPSMIQNEQKHVARTAIDSWTKVCCRSLNKSNRRCWYGREYLNINVVNTSVAPPKQYTANLDMNCVGTWLNFLTSPSGFNGFDQVTNQVHMPVNFLNWSLFLNCIFINQLLIHILCISKKRMF